METHHVIIRNLTILALAGVSLAALATDDTGRTTYKNVPTFTLSMPINEGSFMVMRGGKEVTPKVGAPLMAGDKLMNSSATPLLLEVRSAGGYLCGSIYLIDSTGVTLGQVGMADGNWGIGLTLDYGTIDASLDTMRYGLVVQSAGCTITPTGAHVMIERSSALDNAMTVITPIEGTATVVRPGPYKRYYPVDYLVNPGQQLRFQNFEVRTPRGFYEKVTLGTKMVKRQADVMSDRGN